ncbi:hypothetical protein GGS21DRAFT_522936 [Xylaria nigripes]|nr:hypothetical protein GGS21DRAFT_522936 [Xylaria nigripes]
MEDHERISSRRHTFDRGCVIYNERRWKQCHRYLPTYLPTLVDVPAGEAINFISIPYGSREISFGLSGGCATVPQGAAPMKILDYLQPTYCP